MAVSWGLVHSRRHSAHANSVAHVRSCPLGTWNHPRCTWNICRCPTVTVWQKCPVQNKKDPWSMWANAVQHSNSSSHNIPDTTRNLVSGWNVWSSGWNVKPSTCMCIVKILRLKNCRKGKRSVTMATIFCPHFTQFKVLMRWLGSAC